jgi:hypothetical protein
MEGNSFSPRDDLESLAYTFLFLLMPEKVSWEANFENSIIIEKKKEFVKNQNCEFDWIQTFITIV